MEIGIIVLIHRFFRTSRAGFATPLRKTKRREIFSDVNSVQEMLLLIHIPILLPGFEIHQVSCVETTLTITAINISPTLACLA